MSKVKPEERGISQRLERKKFPDKEQHWYRPTDEKGRNPLGAKTQRSTTGGWACHRDEHPLHIFEILQDSSWGAIRSQLGIRRLLIFSSLTDLPLSWNCSQASKSSSTRPLRRSEQGTSISVLPCGAQTHTDRRNLFRIQWIFPFPSDFIELLNQGWM